MNYDNVELISSDLLDKERLNQEVAQSCVAVQYLKAT